MEKNRYIKAQIEAQVCSSLAEVNSNFTQVIIQYNSNQMEPSNAVRLLKNLNATLEELNQVCSNSDIKVYTINTIKEQIQESLNCIRNGNRISIGE